MGHKKYNKYKPAGSFQAAHYGFQNGDGGSAAETDAEKISHRVNEKPGDQYTGHTISDQCLLNIPDNENREVAVAIADHSQMTTDEQTDRQQRWNFVPTARQSFHYSIDIRDIRDLLTIFALTLGILWMSQLLLAEVYVEKTHQVTAGGEEIADQQPISKRIKFDDERWKTIMDQLVWDRSRVRMEQIPKWANSGDTMPLIIAIAGSAERVNILIDTLHGVVETAFQQEHAEPLNCSGELSSDQLRDHLHTVLTKSEPAVATMKRIENLSWDTPVPFYSFFDRYAPATKSSLILLTVENEFDNVNCDRGVQKYLLSRWSETGGTYDTVTPIVNSRISHFICL